MLYMTTCIACNALKYPSDSSRVTTGTASVMASPPNSVQVTKRQIFTHYVCPDAIVREHSHNQNTHAHTRLPVSFRFRNSQPTVERTYDLAGSERQKHSKAQGKHLLRLREASNINRSLTVLGKVLSMPKGLTQDRPHTTYALP